MVLFGISRRGFLTGLGGAALVPPLLRDACAPSSLPVVGFLNTESANSGYGRMANVFRDGLQEAGFVDGKNVAIEYHWADGHSDRLPAMAADLVRRRVALIAATTTPAAEAAKAATTTIPIVFETGGDPVQLGLVGSFN